MEDYEKDQLEIERGAKRISFWWNAFWIVIALGTVWFTSPDIDTVYIRIGYGVLAGLAFYFLVDYFDKRFIRLENSLKENARLTNDHVDKRLERVLDVLGKKSDGALDTNSDEDLYQQAREAVVDAQTASTAFLQRSLRIGYARAAHILDLLERHGVISPARDRGTRKVLVKN
ncbi:MAG: DNA translocase FtsK [Patescibacteria group bacterium]